MTREGKYVIQKNPEILECKQKQKSVFQFEAELLQVHEGARHLYLGHPVPLVK